MKTSFQLWFLALLLPVLCLSQISLNLRDSSITLFRDQQLKIDFRATGGNGVYQFIFRNVPSWWRVSGNSIIVQQFPSVSNGQTRIEIQVRDMFGNYVTQTVGISFLGSQARLQALTLPVRGTVASSTPGTSPTLEETTSQYPGLTDIDRLL